MLQINEILEWNLESNDEIAEMHRKLNEIIQKPNAKNDKGSKKGN